MSDMDQELQNAAQKLLDTCHDYFKLMSKRSLSGGTIWLTGADGELVIFTRGEYQAQLLRNISTTFDEQRIYSFGAVTDTPK